MCQNTTIDNLSPHIFGCRVTLIMNLNNLRIKDNKYYTSKDVEHSDTNSTYFSIHMRNSANHFNTFISINGFMLALTTNKTGRIIKSK